MTTNKEYEDADAFPLAHISCLVSDLENVLEKAKKRKNKNKIDVLATMAEEMMLHHLSELNVDLEKSYTKKSRFTKKEWRILED
jgi:hypothetical protein